MKQPATINRIENANSGYSFFQQKREQGFFSAVGEKEQFFGRKNPKETHKDPTPGTAGQAAKKAPQNQITSETKFSAPDGSPDTRLNVGVGEKVTFSCAGEGSWTASDGTPSKADNDQPFEWRAPNRETKDVIIRFLVGGIADFLIMQVLEPQSIFCEKISEMKYPAGTAGAGMDLIFHYNPQNVSFGNVESKEVSGPATNINGYFLDFNKEKLWHDSGDQFEPVRPNNQDFAPDEANMTARKKPFKKGWYDWVIPNHFRVVTESNDGKKFTEVTQSFGMADSTGKITIDKGGAHVERSP